MKHKLLFLLAAMLTSASAWAFTVDHLKYEVTSEDSKTVELIGYDGEMPMGSLAIPATVNNDGNDYAVTSIRGGAFYGCSGLTSVTIPNSVTSIGEYAFNY